MNGSKFITKAKLAVIGFGITGGLTMTSDNSAHDIRQPIDNNNTNTHSQFLNTDDTLHSSKFFNDTNNDPKNSRPLTKGELNMLKSIFKESVDCSKIRISNAPHESAPDWSSAVVDGNVIYPSNEYKSNDFSKEKNAFYQKILIHETAHMWQTENQSTFSKMWKDFKDNVKYGPDNRQGRYYYELEKGKDLLDYGIEQQASIIADYYILKNDKPWSLEDFQNQSDETPEQIIAGHYEFYPDDQSTCKEILSEYGMEKSPEELYDEYKKDRTNKLEQYESVLSNFIKDPTLSKNNNPPTPGANPRVKTFSPSTPTI